MKTRFMVFDTGDMDAWGNTIYILYDKVMDRTYAINGRIIISTKVGEILKIENGTMETYGIDMYSTERTSKGEISLVQQVRWVDVP